MNKNEEDCKSLSTESVVKSSKESYSVKSKGKSRGQKRKRCNSESSSEYEDVLAENSVDVDRCLHASAIKNNLDETSVRKIIKKVVTNDRVLALVKMREEEDSGPEEDNLRPKLTRAKVKELRKFSPNTHSTTAWNLENMELTPIKHIPVKTRPEVTALIAQELPEDEDDEEYEPTHDDVPSDDDQGLESCSDLDSQPRTPATPHSQHATSPKVIQDGPFKVPQNLSTPTRRKLDLEEDATIALRTRSKLSLSATSIEHIESTFVPPDDIPMPAVDDLWNQFLNECLNPASTSKNEDDDETDPEYNVAADPDAHDEDEESLSNSIIKISKKELNDLVTELFNIIPETATEEELMADNLANSVLTEHSQGEVSTRWVGKQEPTSDDENGNRQNLSDRITYEKKSYSVLSQGKSEPQDEEATRENQTAIPENNANKGKKQPENRRVSPRINVKAGTVVRVRKHFHDEEEANIEDAPPLLKERFKKLGPPTSEVVYIQVNQTEILPEQVVILQQQLRMHVQLATSSYLQLNVHPIHWSKAPKYKEYLEIFNEMTNKNPNSIVNVCNLKPAVELIATWEKTVSEHTPENQAMVQFIKNESDRCLRRGFNKKMYVGEFHETYLKVVANSPVFLYPYLLPAMPYRGDTPRRYCYLAPEDQLIALGLEQFYQYVNDNPEIYKPPAGRCSGWGLKPAVLLVVTHMLPMVRFSELLNHVKTVRKVGDKQNPINIYMKTRVAPPPVKHKLLPYNPKLSLYEHPEDEVPRIYTRYLAKTSSRFKNYLRRRHNTTGVPARLGVDVELGAALPALSAPHKPPLPIEFNPRGMPQSPAQDKFDVHIADNSETQATPTTYYKFVETSTGAYLLPCTNVTNSTEFKPIIIPNDLPETSIAQQNSEIQSEHCTCCIQLRKICKQRQTTITEYFGTKKENTCSCKEKRYPRVLNRLRLLVNNCKYNYKRALQELDTKIELLGSNETDTSHSNDINLDDVVYVTNFHLKLFTRTYSSDKKTFFHLFKSFNLDDDPLKLAKQVEKVCGTRLEDLYKEFLCFLTPEQVDKINAYKDYFRRNCVLDLIKEVEGHVADLEKRQIILMQLRKVFSKNYTTACEICTDILHTLDGYPALAQYVHSLFPHRKKESLEKICEEAPVSEPTAMAPEPLTEKPSNEAISDKTNADKNICDETKCDESTLVEESIADYEADMSMSEEEDNGGSNSHSDLENNQRVHRPIKKEEIIAEDVTPTSDGVSLHTVVTVSKTEDDSSECSNSSMQIMYEEEIIKTEQPEWTREEDKRILEIFKMQLTPEERRDRTLIEIVEDNNFIRMIADSLPDKSAEDIRARILYLLQIC